jgi:hypothetical protein
MKNPIDMSSVIPVLEIKGDSDEDTRLLKELALQAEAFIKSFQWCHGIKDSYYGFGVGGILAIFYFHIIPANETIDEYLWVIVGDLPPAYLVIDESRTPAEALKSYIYEMQEWVQAAESGQSVEECIR